MLERFFGRREVLDEASIEWQFAVYEWALRQFDSGLFMRRTDLVTPSNRHFPGRADSVPAMAGLVFDQVRQHALMSHWPCQLVSQAEYDPAQQQRVAINGVLRDSAGRPPPAGAEPLLISYVPAQVGNPQALIASFAHLLAHYLAVMAEEAPPGGAENWPHACEVLAGFLGFGLMLANSASRFRRAGCGSCSDAAADRDSHLSQFDLTYGLALFAVLKDIPVKQVLAHLKRPLRPYYRAALKDVMRHERELSALRRLALS